ncbi:MAG: tyrosine-type recombinase/integrase [Candidatus Bathyarchaeota archaeon]|nr:tyrosine-type recombinase/integrase [Candidatus Bathyarchaeota archaeon]
MLNALPRTSERVFNTTFMSISSSFRTQRKRIAGKLQNPRILQITYHTLRHWKATMEYHKTKDIMHVKQTLGHKNIQNTLIYINLEHAIFQTTDDDFIVKVAGTVQDACKLLEVGFEYVTEMDGKRLFRKRK